MKAERLDKRLQGFMRFDSGGRKQHGRQLRQEKQQRAWGEKRELKSRLTCVVGKKRQPIEKEGRVVKISVQP